MTKTAQYLFLFICMGSLLVACSKDDDDSKAEESNLASVSTVSASNVGITTAVIHAEVSSEGKSAVTSRGFAWSTHPAPTVSDSFSLHGFGPGPFTTSIGNLQPNTNYYVRAFATNGFGTAYGEQLVFKSGDYQIGVAYQGGIIAFVDNSGEHGLIAAKEDIGTGTWGCFGSGISGADGTAVGDGEQNTIDILNSCPSSEAAQLAINYSTEGYDDWFLPSKDELGKLFNYHTRIGGFNTTGNTGTIYWASTESDDGFSWALNFKTATIITANKLSPLTVRPIRYF
jgi:hypothetical protein